MVRFLSRSTQTAIDLTVLALAFWMAFLIRFEFSLSAEMLKRVMLLWPWVVVFQYGVMWFVGVPRFAWRYVGLRETNRIMLALAIGFVGLLLMRILSPTLMEHARMFRHVHLPLGVILINFLLGFLGIGGVRVLRRLYGERITTRSHHQLLDTNGSSCTECIPTLLLGAGDAGVLVAKEIAQWPGLGIEPVGFLDDDIGKIGTEIYGIRVLGTTSRCLEIAESTGARQVLITIAKAPGRFVRRIHNECGKAGLAVKIIPGVYEIVSGQVNLDRIRPVAIDDLLGRQPVNLDLDLICEAVREQSVLVTGAGGSIGSELCRQVANYEPSALVLVEQAENSLFEIHRELLASHPELEIIPCIADVTDRHRMDGIFEQYQPSFVFHAAAHKHVPMMEWNPGEAVKNNIFGTKVLVDLAHAHNVGRFVFISTDKAVNPTSIMGATKRVAEIYVQSMSLRSDTRFLAVRFGNVLGSSGSVVPIFREQIAAGGPVTVTHPEMQRYFMTIPEACQLVLQAGSMGEGGEVFILDMGEPVKISDLARDMIRLSGFEPDEDIEIDYCGTRPGEKLYEELSVSDEVADKTRHPKVFIGRIGVSDWNVVDKKIKRLWDVVDEGKAKTIIRRIQDLVPEFVREDKDASVVRFKDTAEAVDKAVDKRQDKGRATA